MKEISAAPPPFERDDNLDSFTGRSPLAALIAAMSTLEAISRPRSSLDPMNSQCEMQAQPRTAGTTADQW